MVAATAPSGPAPFLVGRRCARHVPRRSCRRSLTTFRRSRAEWGTARPRGAPLAFAARASPAPSPTPPPPARAPARGGLRAPLDGGRRARRPCFGARHRQTSSRHSTASADGGACDRMTFGSVTRGRRGPRASSPSACGRPSSQVRRCGTCPRAVSVHGSGGGGVRSGLRGDSGTSEAGARCVFPLCSPVRQIRTGRHRRGLLRKRISARGVVGRHERPISEGDVSPSSRAAALRG